MPKAINNSLVKVVLIGLIAAVCAILLAFWNPLEKQQLYLSNFLYYERPTSNQVTVISIDGEAVSSDGFGKYSSWCRTNYVPALKKLSEYKPAAIGIDILFLSKFQGLCDSDVEAILSSSDQLSELQRYTSSEIHPDDAKLAEALSEIKKLVLAMRITPDSDKSAILGNLSSIQYPLHIFYDAATSVGHNRIFQNTNGQISSIVPAFRVGDQTILSFSVEMVRLALGLDGESIKLSPSLLTIGNDDNALSIPLENYQMMINFSEKLDLNSKRLDSDDKANVIPFMEFIKGGEDYSYLINDRIVLIGVRFDSSEDRYFTSIDPANKQYGVMIHAQAIQTILDRAWLRNMSFPEQAVVILALALAAAAIIFRMRISLALPLLAVLILGYEAAAAPLLFRVNGLILNMVYPPLTIILAAIVGYAYRYVTEFRQKMRVAGALGQYVNAGVAADVLAQASFSDTPGLSADTQIRPGGGEKREVTVIFTDIRGFTSISENLQPQSVVALLNEYLEVMAAEVTRYGGIIDKYEGDALMAFFMDEQPNGPTTDGPTDVRSPARSSHALRAARAALAMRAALPKLNKKWQTDPPLPGGEQKPQIDFRAGLSSGEAIVGNIGTITHIQYTVIGDTINLGSRLESANKKYQSHVMISDATYEAIKDLFACRFLDYIRVKGKSKPVAVYELLSEHSQLRTDQKELIQAYNSALELYFKRDFEGALKALQNNVLSRWPKDYPATIYAARCEKYKIYPPAADWDFVYEMDSK